MIHFRGNVLRAPTLHIRAGNIKYSDSTGLFVYRGVAQLVARTAGGREVAGSSPVVPTTINLA